MEEDRNDTRHELAKRFSKLEKVPVPKGFVSTCKDIDINIYEYDGYIAGLVDSYLSGSDIDFTNIDQGQDLYRRLGECETRLHDLRAYLDMVSEVATLLTECLDTKF